MSKERVEDAVLKAFNIDLDGVDAFQFFGHHNIEKGPHFDIDRSLFGNSRLTEVALTLLQSGGTVMIANGVVQNTNDRSRIYVDVKSQALPQAGMRFDRDDLSGLETSDSIGDPQ